MATKRRKSSKPQQTQALDPAKFNAAMEAAEKAEKKHDLYLWQAFVAASSVSNHSIINFTAKVPGEDFPHMQRYAVKIKVADVLRDIATRFPGLNIDEQEALRFAAHVVDHSVNETDNGE